MAALVREENHARKRVRSQDCRAVLGSMQVEPEESAGLSSDRFALLPYDSSSLDRDSNAGKPCHFGEEGARVGRDPATSDLCLSLKDISRLHCVFSVVGGRVYVRDTSFNGTFVNGKPVGRDRTAELADGDMISFVNPFLSHAAAYSYSLAMPRNRLSSSWQPLLTSSAITERYTLGPMIGQGSYAVVYTAKDKTTDDPVAIKVLDKRRFPPNVSEDSLRLEAELIRSLSHPNIVRVHDTIDTEDTIALIMELVPEGDLFDYVVGRGKSPFTENEACVLFLQLVEAVRYIHSRKVIHCDLKPENILVSRRPCSSPVEEGTAENSKVTSFSPSSRKTLEGSVASTLVAADSSVSGAVSKSQLTLSPYKVTLKLTDFGVAQYSQQHVRPMAANARSPGSATSWVPAIGTPAYAAPELLALSAQGPSETPFPLGPAVDIWSLGVLLYILCSGSRPKRRVSTSEPLVLHKHMEHLSSKCKDLISGLLTLDPQKRLTMEQVLQHPWLGIAGAQPCLSDGMEIWSLTASPTSPRYSSAFPCVPGSKA